MIKFSRPLWTAQEVALALNLQEGQPFLVDGIAIDSRAVKPGELFIALRGENHDGHDFVAGALRQGASRALVARDYCRADGVQEGQLIRVPRPEEAMAQLAGFARQRSKAIRVAVTGSVGKTTLTHCLRDMVGLDLLTQASERSFNNHIGVPLTLARLHADTRIGVFEMGMNHAGELTQLSQQVQPDIAIITTIAPAHIGHFSGLKDIAEAKLEILDGVKTGGTAILGIDHDFADLVVGRAKDKGLRVITVSAEKEADVKIHKKVTGAGSTSAMISVCGTPVALRIGQPGLPALMAGLFTLAAASATNCDLARISAGLADIRLPEGRGGVENLMFGRQLITLVDDSYNANPASFKAALDRLNLLKSSPGTRVHVVAGDMLELGDFSARLHDDILADIANICTGDLMLAGAEFSKALKRRKSFARLQADHLSPDIATDWAQLIAKRVRQGDTLLVKGSKASGVSALIPALRRLSVTHLDHKDTATPGYFPTHVAGQPDKEGL